MNPIIIAIYAYFFMVITHVGYTVVLLYFFKGRFKSNLMTIIMSCVLAFIARFIFQWIGDIHIILIWIRGLLVTPIFMAPIFRYKSFWKFFGFNILETGVMIVTEMVTMRLGDFVTNHNLFTEGYSYDYDRYIMIVEVLNVSILALLMVIVFYVDQMKKKQIGYWCIGVVALITALQLAIAVIFFQSCADYNLRIATFGVFITIFILGLDGFLLYFLQKVIEKIDIERTYQTLYHQRKLELQYYEETEQHIERMRELRHEFVNQLQIFYSLLENGESDEKLADMLEKCEVELEGIAHETS